MVLAIKPDQHILNDLHLFLPGNKTKNMMSFDLILFILVFKERARACFETLKLWHWTGYVWNWVLILTSHVDVCRSVHFSEAQFPTRENRDNTHDLLNDVVRIKWEDPCKMYIETGSCLVTLMSSAWSLKFFKKLTYVIIRR